MPKKQPDLCMLCGGSPCECDGVKTKRKSKASPRKVSSPAPKPTVESSPTSSSVVSDSDTEDVFGEIPTPEKSKFSSSSPSDEDPDLSYFAALRLLRPLLTAPSRRVVDEELNPPYPQSLDRRIAEWKKHVRSESRKQR